MIMNIEYIQKSLIYARDFNQGLYLTHEDVPELLGYLDALEAELKEYETWTDQQYQAQIKKAFYIMVRAYALLGDQAREVYDLLDAAMRNEGKEEK